MSSGLHAFSMFELKLSIMKKAIPFILFLGFLASCGSENNAQKQEQKQDSILQAQQDSLLNIFKEELDAIDQKISEAGSSQGLFEDDSLEGQVLSRERIIQKVEALDNMLSEKQSRLNDIYNRMRESKVKNDKLEQMIQSMQDRLAQREKQIDEMMVMLAEKDLEIEDIKARVDSMRQQNIGLTEDLIQMEDQMHEVYYIVDESKALKEKGIITKEGGLLGIGGTKQLDVSKLDNQLFKSADMRDLNEVLLYSKKARLITNHPEGSYEWIEAEDGSIDKLDITDKEAFWKASDYLVVEVSN